MHARLLGLSAVFVATALLGAAQSGPAGTFGTKERIGDVPTPGRLGGLRTEPPPPLTLDATGVEVSLPDIWETDPVTGAEYRRGEVLVRFRTGATPLQRQRALSAIRGERVARTLPGNWALVELEPGADPRNVGRTGPDVLDVAPNYRLQAQQVRPNDEFFHLQWNFDAINLPAAWEINPGARNDVVVAVIDSGVNTLTATFIFHSPLVGQIPVRFAAVPDLVSEAHIVSPWDFMYEDEFPIDLGGHGTHVSGTIAQQTNNNIGVAGIAYNVKLMPLKVIPGAGGIVSWDDIFNPGHRGGTAAIVADAIRYAADNGATVINLSLGGIGPVPTVRDALAYAVSRGAFVAIAAGNSGSSGNPVLYPAAYASEINGVMAVGAVNRNSRRAAYSSFHPYVEICAPGGETTGTFDYERGVTQVGYDESVTLSFLSASQKLLALSQGFRPRFDSFELRPFQGTSMAAPHVAGVAALLYSQGIRSPGAIEEAIKRFARPVEATIDECGAGLVDARRALRGLGLAR